MPSTKLSTPTFLIKFVPQFMNTKTVVFFTITLFAFTSCKTYEVMRYKSTELGKIKDVGTYKVYVHSQKNVYSVAKPSLAADGITGDITPVTDVKAAEDIKNPGNLKKHSHDLNLFTKTTIPDTASGMFTFKKNDITEYSLVLSHSHVNWGKIGDIVADVFGTAACLAVLGALVYWFTLI